MAYVLKDSRGLKLLRKDVAAILEDFSGLLC